MRLTSEVEKEEVAANRLKTIFKANAVFKAFERRHGILIPKASKENFARLKSQVGSLTREERLFCALVQNSLVYSHGSEYLQAILNSGFLSPLKERAYAGEATQHAAGVDDVGSKVFCTVELGNIPAPPSFLGNNIDFLRIEPALYQQHFPGSALGFAWVSHHLTEFRLKARHQVYFGDVRYSIAYHPSMETTYRYEYPNGESLEINTPHGEEIFMGSIIPYAIALRLILHLRRLNKGYSAQLYERNHFQTVYEMMKYTWPSQMYPELKIPGRLKLLELDGSKGVTKIVRSKESSFLNSRLSLCNSVSAVSDCLRSYSPLVEKLERLKQLHASGESFTNRDSAYYNSPLYCVLENTQGLKLKDQKKLLSFLLSLKFTNLYDKHLSHSLLLDRAHVSRINDPISHVCFKGSVELLKMLVDEGQAELSRFPLLWMNMAASAGHLDIVCFIVDHCKLNCEQLTFDSCASPLLVFAKKNNGEGVCKMLSLGFSVNALYPHQNEYFGWSTLHFAVFFKNKPLLEFLLSQPGIELDVKSVIGETPFSIAHCVGDKAIKQDLIQAGAKEDLMLYKGPRYSKFRINAVAVVTGVDDHGKRVVALGKKWSTKTGVTKKYQFPGGLKDYSDADFVCAAVREFYEETSIELPAESVAEARELYRYVEGSKETWCNTVFIHIELGENLVNLLKTQCLRAQDDLAYVTWLPLDTVEPVVPSNKWLLGYLRGLETDFSKMQGLCSIENFLSENLESVIKQSSIPLFKEIIQHAPEAFNSKVFVFSARHANAEFLLSLLALLSDEQRSDCWGPAMSSLMHNENLEQVIKQLIALTLLTQKECFQAFCLAVELEKESSALQLLQHSPAIASQYPLVLAIRAQQWRVVDSLLAYPVEINSEISGCWMNGKLLLSSLMQAIVVGNLPLFHRLIEKGADINCLVQYNFEQEAQDKNIRLSKMTLFSSPQERVNCFLSDASFSLQCPLFLALFHAQVEMAQFLFQQSGIDKAQVVECINALEDEVLEQKFYGAIRGNPELGVIFSSLSESQVSFSPS